MRSCITVSRRLRLAAALAGALPAHLGAQDHETIRTLLIGPRETATVDLTLIGPQANDTLTPWRLRVPPLASATGTAARLWTDLPITIGNLTVPPGTHRLRLEDGRVLALTRESGDSAQVITFGYGPATRSTLRLRWRDRELVAPIAAR